ncbi:MAG TPA: hypothetical protein VGN51_10235 [Acidimicrobiia bacterium]|jgi:uncharacterized membrane protein
MHDVLLFAAAFLASAVEMVEALTIVLAVGVTRGWRSAAFGVGAALVALAVIVVVLGPAITRLPIDALRVVVGSVLLIFGLQWLRKAILRASGLKALHDEDAIYRAEVDELGQSSSHDWYAFTVAFKGVFLEGLEVAFLVVTFGGAQHNIGLAAAGAASALVIVVIVGAFVHAPLSRVPENTLKFGVGVMLTSFGMFWSAEGAGADWPGGDAAILVLLVAVLAVSLAIVGVARRPATLTSGSAT